MGSSSGFTNAINMVGSSPFTNASVNFNPRQPHVYQSSYNDVISYGGNQGSQTFQPQMSTQFQPQFSQQFQPQLQNPFQFQQPVQFYQPQPFEFQPQYQQPFQQPQNPYSDPSYFQGRVQQPVYNVPYSNYQSPMQRIMGGMTNIFSTMFGRRFNEGGEVSEGIDALLKK